MHIRFLSEEYLNRDFTAKRYCLDNGIEIHYHKREHTFSSTELRKRIFNLEKEKELEILANPKNPVECNIVLPHSIDLLKN